MFDQIFPPSFDPINAGFCSMAEADIDSRVHLMCLNIQKDWGTILPSADIITDALAKEHLDWWMLPPSSRKFIDLFFDIVED